MTEDHLSDAQLKMRTEELLRNAERISQQLMIQTTRLSEAIDSFDREIIQPLRKGLKGL